MADSPFPTPGNAWRYNNDMNTDNYSKDFLLMDVIYRDILRLYGDKAYYITVDHFNTDEFFGESRTKVLDRAFEVLLWNPDVVDDNISHNFVSNGFSFINEGELTYYAPMSYFQNMVDHDTVYIEHERTFEIAETMEHSTFIQDDTVYFYNQDLTAEDLYTDINTGDTVTLAGCGEATNNADYIVSAIAYNEIETWVGEEQIFVWRTEITLTPNDGVDIIDEELVPTDFTITITKIVDIRPKITDLLWIPKLEQLYQIEYVNDTPPHLMFNRNLSYVFNVSLYDYNSNVDVSDNITDQIPELADLEDLNELVLDVTNEIIEEALEDGDVLDETEDHARDTNTRPSSRFGS